MGKIRCAIIGGGLGVGCGMICVAFMAAAVISIHRPERLHDEVLMILMCSCAGIALGWLAGGPLRHANHVSAGLRKAFAGSFVELAPGAVGQRPVKGTRLSSAGRSRVSFFSFDTHYSGGW
jgi:hypothetical protein